jgi:hypothetical protein
VEWGHASNVKSAELADTITNVFVGTTLTFITSKRGALEIGRATNVDACDLPVEKKPICNLVQSKGITILTKSSLTVPFAYY